MNNLICEICNKNFDVDLHKPMSLPCGHTNCNFCISSIIGKISYFECTKCKKLHFSKLEQIPINLYIYDRLERKIKHLDKKLPKSDPTYKNQRESRKFSIKNFAKEKNKITKTLSLTISKNSIEQKDNFQENGILDCSQNETFKENKERKSSSIQFHHLHETIFFLYFDAIKELMDYIDYDLNKRISHLDYNNFILKKLKNLIMFLINFTAIISILALNYFLIKNNIFFVIFMFIILTLDSKACMEDKNVNHLNNCNRRWFCYIFLLIIDYIINKSRISDYSASEKIWKCLTTIYVMFITGPPSILHIVYNKVIKFLNSLNLIISKEI